MPGCRRRKPRAGRIDRRAHSHRSRTMTRMLLILFLFAATTAAAFIYRNAEAVALASDNVAAVLRERSSSQARAVQIPRGQGGEFALRARINGAAAPMVIDTGATSVVLTYETA